MKKYTSLSTILSFFHSSIPSTQSQTPRQHADLEEGQGGDVDHLARVHHRTVAFHPPAKAAALSMCVMKKNDIRVSVHKIMGERGKRVLIGEWEKSMLGGENHQTVAAQAVLCIENTSI
jgi:hypothetical protein